MRVLKVSLIIIFFIGILFLNNTYLYSQNINKYYIKGIVVDSTTRQPISYVSLALVNPSDNKIIKSTISNEDGVFKFNSVSSAKYHLVISCISYGKSSRVININGNDKNVDLGKLKLSKQSVTLEDVIIEGLSIPVMVKGDTIEFNAASFKTDSNAVIEELIKKLPGVEVDKDGNIKAQGKDVMRVFVDGKPFFGDDPKIATKNLPVNMIDKVQIVDKKSDQAMFTQIDDGEVETIMNLITKKGKKDGTFGKATAGIGNEGRYDESANLNWFKNERQVSVIGTLNNINNLRFSDFTALDQTTNTNVLNKNISNSSGIYSANSNGISKSWSAGANYRDSLGSKISFVGSYLYSGNENSKILENNRTTFISDSTLTTKNNQNSPSQSYTHNIHLEFDYGIDSMNSIFLYPHIKVNQNNSDLFNYYSSQGKIIQRLDTVSSEKQRDKKTINTNVELLLRHKFHKPRRTLSLSVIAGTTPITNQGYNKSNSIYFPDPTIYNVDHMKNNLSGAVTWDAKLSYTEPLTYNVVLELSYHYKLSTSFYDRKTFDYNPLDSLYDVVNIKLTNRYDNVFQDHKAGINVKVFKKKWDYTIGVILEPTTLVSNFILLGKDSSITLKTFNFSPQFILNATPRKGKKLSIKYKGNSDQPSLNQLQPVLDNSNPIHLYIGNPSLKPEYDNTLTINYNTTNLVNFNYFYSNLIFVNSFNKITNMITYNVSGVDTTMPVNVNGTYNMNLNAGIGKPIKKFFLNFGCNTGYTKDINFLNQSSFTTKVLSLGFSSRLNYNGERLVYAPIAKISINKAWYDLASYPNSQYLNYMLGFEFQVDLFWNIKIGSDVQYIKNNGFGQGYNLDMTIWNAFISEQIFSNKRGTIKFQIYDILKQNKSIFRTTFANYIEDDKVNNISQFFIVSFSYSFSKFQGKQPKSKGSKKKSGKPPKMKL